MHSNVEPAASTVRVDVDSATDKVAEEQFIYARVTVKLDASN